MVAKRWTLDEADGNLREVLELARRDGPQQVSDPRGGVFQIEAVPVERGRGIREGERFSEWVRRTLEPGESIEDYPLRNEEGHEHRERWIREMAGETEVNGGPASAREEISKKAEPAQ